MAVGESPVVTSTIPLPNRLVGLFFCAFILLFHQILLTRIFSVITWYHFAFVAISIALLGWGLGGMVVHLGKRQSPLTIEQAAAALEISTTTADRDWTYARAWLFREMAKGNP